MDISTTIAHVQFLIFTWTLLGFLLAWLFTFAWLALRPDPQKKAELEDSSLFSHAIPTTTVPGMLQAITRQPLQIQPGTIEQEPGCEVGKAPIA